MRLVFLLVDHETAEGLSGIDPYTFIRTMKSNQTTDSGDGEISLSHVISRIGPVQHIQTNTDGEVMRDPDGIFQRTCDILADAEYKFGEDESVRNGWANRFNTVLRERRFILDTVTTEHASGYINLERVVDDHIPSFDQFSSRDSMQDRSTDVIVQSYLNRCLDTDCFEDTIAVGIRMLDNAIEQTEYPVDDVEERIRSTRKLSIGVMGFSEMLSQLGISYGSDEAVIVAQEVADRINTRAVTYSHELAKVRGPYLDWDESKWADLQENAEWFEQQINKQPSEVDEAGYLMRNEIITNNE